MRGPRKWPTSLAPIFFQAFGPYDRDCLIEFLKTLQVLPSGIASSVINERGRPRSLD